MGDKVVVGKIATAFGIKGWVKVISFTEPTENITQYRQWAVFRPARHGTDTSVERRTLTVDESRRHGDGLIVHFDGIDDRDEAKALAQYLIEIDAEELPLLGAGEYYWHQLEGLSVYQATSHSESEESAGALLGRVDHLLETGANDVLVVRPTEGSIDQRERLIPYLPGDVVVGVDLSLRRMLVDWDAAF